MRILPILAVLILTVVFAATTDSPIGNGKCITVEKDNQIMFEVPSGNSWPGYLKFTTKGSEDDNQKWFLVKSGNNNDNYFKLKNKATNKTVDIQAYLGYDYLKTTDYPNHSSSRTEFKFSAKNTGEYGILTKNGRPTKVDGNGWVWLPSSGESDSYKIQSCPSK
jgi:hypothetical protein